MESSINNFRYLDQIVGEFFELALKEPYDSFKEAAFKLFAEHLDADSGVWITRAEQQIPFYEQDALTLNLPKGFIEDYHDLSSVSQQVQQIFGVMLGNLGHTKDILDILPEEDWLASDMYKLYCEKYQLYHSLMTVTVAPENQLMHIITLARHNVQKPFSVTEKQIKEFLVPNLCAALKLNILDGFQASPSKPGLLKVVVDHYGNLIEADDEFWCFADENSLINQGKLAIPRPIVDEFTIGDTRFRAVSARGLLYLYATANEGNSLTKRQREILSWVTKGLSNKEIADKLGISEATVKNHVKSILKTKNCESREQLISRSIKQN
ncbi:helix-turn-helix transcriptional regulator [uncultured Pseudoteredinibacter sp.]|uniref:helix-turn-helix domain-containing protein n=1 Tax=uncultured Pseudoteredinibacter sp. TaxID=1641701 RepID=UPI00263702F5|nr:helix-turn-helix transcriptional regulator [uncultured Pseudoteredinibacter sp.]